MGARPLTTLDAALTGVTALGFDTAPLIYFIERHPAYLDVLRAVFRSVDSGIIAGYSSVITLTEVLTKPSEVGNTRLIREYRALLLDSRNFTLIAIDAAVAARAADVRARYRLRTPDALQIAAALHVGCDALLTNDRTLRRVTDLRVLILADLER
jgi:predicted nucleic acid-binding protein